MAFLLLVQFRLWVPNFDTHNVTAVLTWDALGYYLYLPAHFIYHDLATLSFMPDIMREYQPSGSYYQSFPFPGAAPGAQVMKYPIGLAVLNTPFFGLGHWAAGHWGYKQDGFSAPYQMAISLGGLLYALLGLGLLRRVLLRFWARRLSRQILGRRRLGAVARGVAPAWRQSARTPAPVRQARRCRARPARYSLALR